MPAVLLLAGVVGIVIPDAATRTAIVDFVAGVLPPLRELMSTILREASRDAGSITVLGLVALVWGASRFVIAFDGAMTRVTGRSARSGVVRRNADAIVSVLLLIGAIVLAALVGTVLALIEAGVGGRDGPVGAAIRLGLSAVPPIVTCGAMILVYRTVPQPRPAWRATAGPGLVAGLVLTLLGWAFLFAAPRLIGAAALLGTLAAVFVALAWLGLSFQVILLGGAWMADRGLPAADD